MLSLPSSTIALPVAAIGVTLAAFMALVERRRPAWQRSESPAWWSRAIVFNAAQVGVAALGVIAWQVWFSTPVLSYTGHGWLSVLVGYLLVTFVYYWWHRARHGIPLLWRALHRFHHSPTRVEVLTSFYKHPLELVANSVLTSTLLHLVLGLNAFEVSAVVLLMGMAELFYHWNIRTPRWLGWIVQRPEMHRLHHARGLHHYNYSDLPLWDALFGTLRNPHYDIPLCGFPDEQRVVRLLLGRNVREV